MYASNHYLLTLYAHGKENGRHECEKFWVHIFCSRVLRLSRYLVTLHAFKCLHELGSAYDVFTIKCINGNMIDRHLPREISRPTKYLFRSMGDSYSYYYIWTLSEIFVVSRWLWNSMCNHYDSNSLRTLHSSKIWAVCQNFLCWAEGWSFYWLLSHKNWFFRHPNKLRDSCKEEEKEHKGQGEKQRYSWHVKKIIFLCELWSIISDK